MLAPVSQRVYGLRNISFKVVFFSVPCKDKFNKLYMLQLNKYLSSLSNSCEYKNCAQWRHVYAEEKVPQSLNNIICRCPQSQNVRDGSHCCKHVIAIPLRKEIDVFFVFHIQFLKDN